jgi:hypothetical protein
MAAGTGKTLSLICSVLQWLEDKREAEVAAATITAEGTAQAAEPISSGGQTCTALLVSTHGRIMAYTCWELSPAPAK